MALSAYDSDDFRALYAAFSDVIATVKSAGGGAATETSIVSARIARSLARAYDLGERDSSALRRAGLRGILVLSRDKQKGRRGAPSAGRWRRAKR
jgi:hypothetical protein